MVAGLWEPPSWPILVTRFIQPPLLLLLPKYSQIHWNPLQIALLAICSFLSSPLLLWKQFLDSFSEKNDYSKYCKPTQPRNAARFASKYMHREVVYRFNPIGGKISFDLLDLVKLATCPPFFEWATAWQLDSHQLARDCGRKGREQRNDSSGWQLGTQEPNHTCTNSTPGTDENCIQTQMIMVVMGGIVPPPPLPLLLLLHYRQKYFTSQTYENLPANIEQNANLCASLCTIVQQYTKLFSNPTSPPSELNIPSSLRLVRFSGNLTRAHLDYLLESDLAADYSDY